jgi:uncharacterized membrane protein YidH (DUF202 family)
MTKIMGAVVNKVKEKVVEAVKEKVVDAVSSSVDNEVPEPKPSAGLLETGTQKAMDMVEAGKQKLIELAEAYRKQGYSPNAFNQLFSWGVFMCFFLFAWQLTIQTVTKRYDKQIDSTKELPRRPYLVAVCAYSLVVFLLNMTILYIFAFIGCTVIVLSAPYVPLLLEPLIYVLFLPEIVFSAISLKQVPLHFFVLITALLLQVGMVWFYITEKDLGSPVIVRAKMIRILCIVPGGFLGIVYACYAIYSAMYAK